VAARFKKHFGVETQLTSGGRGEFTIWVDGAKVFDKATHGDFPSDDEAVRAVEEVRRRG
jgi:predicted Rdx family selenoprotein